MRRISILFSIVATALMINAVPSLSFEGTTMGGQAKTDMQKDECLLVAKNCASEVDTLQERITRLQAEINKGTAVYTSSELKTLNDELTEAYDNYRHLIAPH